MLCSTIHIIYIEYLFMHPLQYICRDKKGIVAAFAQLLYGHGCNIVDAEQHTDVDANRFFQRIVFDYGDMHTDRISLSSGIDEVCTRFGMAHNINWGERKKNVCIFVSKYDHVIWEILLRHKAGELPCNVSLIISNHEDLRHIADHFGIRFEVFKITKDTKREQEDAEIALMKSLDVDLVILARYMQIITDEFCNTFKHAVIVSIHHIDLQFYVSAATCLYQTTLIQYFHRINHHYLQENWLCNTFKRPRYRQSNVWRMPSWYHIQWRLRWNKACRIL